MSIKFIDFIRRGKNKIFLVSFCGLAALVCLFLYLWPAYSGTPKFDTKVLTPEYIMSSVYKVYGNPKLGFWASKTILTNTGTAPAYDLKFSYKIDNVADWSEPKVYPVLLPGSTIVDLNYPVLSAEIAKLETSMPSNVNVKISYSVKSEGKSKEFVEIKPINILGGHDFIFSSIPPEDSTGTFYDTFSNYPLVAAYVTPADPVVMAFADLGTKLAGGAGASLSDEGAINSLAGIWTVAVNNGIEYKTEPAAFWTGKVSQFVKYPRDVIKDRAGTCFDTAIWLAASAASQGLKSYVIMMPGHAFPVIQLPSGQNVAIESTALNSKVSFEEAVQAGSQSYEKAMQGPYVVVDVEMYQGLGVVPPELEPLSSNILKEWGISQFGSATSETKTNSSGSGSSSSGSGALATFANPYPVWKISYPNNWTVNQITNEVDFYSPGKEVEFIVTWGYGITASDVRTTVEQYLLAPLQAQSGEQKQTKVGGISATEVTYSATVRDLPYLLTAKYFESQGVGYAVIYDFPNDGQAAKNNSAATKIVNSFSF